MSISKKKMNNFSMGLSIVSILVIIFTIVVLVYIGGKYFMFELPLIENAYAQKTGSEFFREMVDKSYDNPDMVFYYFETSDSMHGRTYTDSNGQRITEIKDGSASYIAKSCPSDKIVGSAVSQGEVSGYVYTAIVQNGDFIDYEEGITRATAVGKCAPVKNPSGGGCLIATATFGSELAPQVQQLRELRDNTLLQTSSGKTFMNGFNQFYYSFSPTIADWERQNPVFKEAVKITITPLITSLSILNYVDMDSEAEVLGYGISLILLNVGMYLVAPVGIGIVIRGYLPKIDILRV